MKIKICCEEIKRCIDVLFTEDKILYEEHPNGWKGFICTMYDNSNDGERVEDIKIKHCPFCGKKLELE